MDSSDLPVHFWARVSVCSSTVSDFGKGEWVKTILK
jgi:hypothetical protein